jgi:Uma2 family endonuclease
MGTIDVRRFTADDYRRLPPEAPRVELLAGRFVEMTPSPSDRHQDAAGRLHVRLVEFVETRRLGVVRIAPYDVELDLHTVVQPDLLVVLAEHDDRRREDGLHGAPDLVVEILSKSTAMRDLTDKLEMYRAAGIPEYWVVDPDGRAVHVHRLQESSERVSFGANDRIRSPLLPGFDAVVGTLFQHSARS